MASKTALHPTKKYKRYKDSGVEWLGEIPEHWEVKKVFYFFKAEKGKRAATLTKEYCGNIKGVYPVYSGQTENGGIMSFINEFEFDYSLDGCLFTTTVGAKAMTVNFLQGKFSLSQNCMIIVKRNNEVSNKYTYYQFQTLFAYFRNKIPDHMQASFRMDDLYQYKFILPPLTEQTAIAQFLDDKTTKIDEAITIKEQQINLLKERKQILIHKAVTRGLDANVTLKNSGVEWIGEIPEHWEVKRFRYVFNLGKGLTITKDNLREEGVFCVNYGEIHSKYGFELDTNIHKLKCVDEDYLLNNPSALINYGDFIFADTSEDIEGSGNFTYLESKDEIFAGYHTVVAKPKFDIESRFFAYIFESESFRNQIRTKVKGVKVFSITQSILKQPTVWYPSKNEQKEIVDYLDSGTKKIERAIGLKQQEIAKLKEYKSSLINGVVTGKVRVC